MLDVGQYHESWKNVHMLPRESVKASKDLKAKKLLAIHNSKYVLSLHDWYEPLNKALEESKKQNVSLITPRIGQTFKLNETLNETWWK